MTREEQLSIQKDRMRYIKNTFSSGFALLAILFDVFYFVNIYRSDVGTYYYRILIGVSVIYNLVFMLAAFLASEGIKIYMKRYAYLLLVIGSLQIVRIFILPMQAHSAIANVQGVDTIVMQNSQFTFVVSCLVISAICCFISALVGIRKTNMLNEHLKATGEKIA